MILVGIIQIKPHERDLAGDIDGNLSSQHWDYDYDDQDQLIFAKAYGQDEPIGGLEFNYSFDAVGNHTESGWTTNLANQVTHIPGLSPEITYDNRGNVLYDGQFHYTWDAADHLIKAENSVAKFEFGYDSQGRRTWKKSFGWVNNAWNLGQHLIFAYDGWNLMAEYEQVTVGSGQNEHIEHHLLRSYAWGQSLGGGIGGLLSITDHTPTTGPKTYYPFYDGNGNIMGLTDNTGQVAATYRYDPFGKLLSSAGPAADINPFRFSTKYYDADTQLYYFGYRSYSPEMQRWMSRDPIEEDGGLNIYAFVGNDPVNRVDPLGLDDKQVQEWISDLQRHARTPEEMMALRIGLAATIQQRRISLLSNWIVQHDQRIEVLKKQATYGSLGWRHRVAAEMEDRLRRRAINEAEMAEAQRELQSLRDLYVQQGLAEVSIDVNASQDLPHFVSGQGFCIAMEAARTAVFVRDPGLKSTGDECFLVPAGTILRFAASRIAFSARAVAVAREGEAVGADATQTAVATLRRGGVAELEAGPFRELAARSARDGLTPDHIPSFASVRAAVERHLGRELTAAEATALRNETNAIIVKTRSHQLYSRTYGGRNTPQQILRDSLDQERAFQLDRQAWRQQLINEGHSPRAVDAAFDLLDNLNRQAGRY